MLEETPVNQTIGNARNAHNLVNRVLNDSNGGGSIMFTGESEFLEIDTETGDIRVIARVDRETSGMDNCIYIALSVNENNQGAIMPISIGVVVEDINDNPPIFIQEPGIITREEGGNFTYRFRVGDDDLGQNAHINYTIDGENADLFVVENDEIISKQVLDRELVQNPSNTSEFNITLTVIATDGAPPYHQSSSTLKIVIRDVNDNSPKLTAASLERIEIRKNASNGDIVRVLNATDLDFNNSFTFELQVTNAPIMLMGRTLEVRKQDKFLDVRSHELQVTVSDGEHSNDFTITLDVLDVNTRATIMFKSIEIAEETLPEGRLLFLSIADAAATDTFLPYISGPFSENLTAVFRDGAFFDSIDIFLDHPFDQEQIRGIQGNNTITVSLTIDEIGPFANFTHTGNIVITVLGINDNVPFLRETEFSAEEETGTDRDLEMIDLDDGVNGTIVSYSIVKATAFSATDTSLSTDLTLAFKDIKSDNPIQNNEADLNIPILDRENDIDLIKVTIELTDGGGRSNLVNVTIHILDINDNCPYFKLSTLPISFDEGEVYGIQESVTAKDNDTGLNAEIFYELLDNDDSLFAVNSSTGQIVANGSFDRETKDTYTVNIRAKNAIRIESSSCMWEMITVKIKILDVNDNSPKWENLMSRYTVYSDADSDQLVTTLTATDRDLESKITYQMEPNSLFRIENNGVIRVESDLSDQLGTHILEVSASDGDFTSTENITIEVLLPGKTAQLAPGIIATTIGLCVLLVVAIVIITAIILVCIFLDRRRKSVKFSKRNGRMDVDGAPTRGILRQIPRSSPNLNGRSNGSSITGTSARSVVKFEKTVHKYGYDYDNGGPDVTQSHIHLDSSGDESPVTPPRLPTASSHHHHNHQNHHHNGKISSHSHSNGRVPVTHLPPIAEDLSLNFPFVHRPRPLQPEYSASDDSDGNSEDDESTLPDNASSTNDTLPNTRHLTHMASSPRATPPNSNLGGHLQMAPISPSHQFQRSPVDHRGGLSPPHHEELSLHSSSSESLTATPQPPAVHPHVMPHETQRLTRPSGRSAYPVHMPEGYLMPPSSRYVGDPFISRYGGGTDFGDASTYTSADLDDALHFNPDQELGIYSLTATSSYDEESQL